MIIFPAIDIQDGKVVRLLQGRFGDVTEYGQDPVKTARHWEKKGAQWLHVVDLNGAREGTLKNKDLVIRIAQSVSIPIEVGGGIRTLEDIAQFIEGGVQRVILGTKAVEDRNFVKKVLSRWPENIAVSLDCRDGKVACKGWTSMTEIKAVDFAKEMETLGLKYLIYTDIKRDGMLSGPDLAGLEQLLDAVGISVIASGGISDIEDIKKLFRLEPKGLLGAITGKALYEGTLHLEAALKLCSQKE